MASDELVPWLRGLLECDLEGWRSLEVVFLPRAEHEDRYLYARAREHAARCEAELAVLDLYEKQADKTGESALQEDRTWTLAPVVRLIGHGYRFRPGYREAEWRPWPCPEL